MLHPASSRGLAGCSTKLNLHVTISHILAHARNVGKGTRKRESKSREKRNRTRARRCLIKRESMLCLLPFLLAPLPTARRCNLVSKNAAPIVA